MVDPGRAAEPATLNKRWTRRQAAWCDALTGVEPSLDYSVDSLRLLTEASRKAFRSRWMRRRAVSAYLGEVLIRNSRSGRWVGTPRTRPDFVRKPAVRFGAWTAYPIRASRQAWIRRASNEALYDYANHVLRFADNPEEASNEPGWLRLRVGPPGQYKGSLDARLSQRWAIRHAKQSRTGHDDGAGLVER
jgi:hypothetical protein